MPLVSETDSEVSSNEPVPPVMPTRTANSVSSRSRQGSAARFTRGEDVDGVGVGLVQGKLRYSSILSAIWVGDGEMSWVESKGEFGSPWRTLIEQLNWAGLKDRPNGSARADG